MNIGEERDGDSYHLMRLGRQLIQNLVTRMARITETSIGPLGDGNRTARDPLLLFGVSESRMMEALESVVHFIIMESSIPGQMSI